MLESIYFSWKLDWKQQNKEKKKALIIDSQSFFPALMYPFVKLKWNDIIQ